jgi:hypothetical protein
MSLAHALTHGAKIKYIWNKIKKYNICHCVKPGITGLGTKVSEAK